MQTFVPNPLAVTAARITIVLVLATTVSGCGASDDALDPRPSRPAAATTRASHPDAAEQAVVTWEHRPIAKSDLDASTGVRWFFGHQSVGANVLKGVNTLYKANGLGKPILADLGNGGALPSTGGVIAHAHVGRNGHPLEKLAHFDAILRGGVASQVDAAVLKFCYSDVREGRVDIADLFDEYRRVLGALERDYPEVSFLHATVPLKADTAADNVARTRMNALLRAEYASTGRLWDIAAIESTTLEGERVGGTLDGQPYQALNPGFTHDGGHLYIVGTEVAAAPLLELVVRAAG